MKKNDIIKLEILDVDYEGNGIARYENKAVIVKNAIVGEVVNALVLKDNKNIAFAKTIEILKPSQYRVEPQCQYYKLCGGCNMMHIDYAYQLVLKKKMVENTLFKMIGKHQVNDVVKNDNIYGYRNKIQVPIGHDGQTFIKGFYRTNSHDIVSSEKCLIEPQIAKEIFDELLPLFEKYNVKPYDEKAHEGEIRHVLIRVTSTNEVMIVFVSNENITNKLQNIIGEMKTEIKSYYLNINNNKTNVILGREFIHLANEQYLIETFDGLKFKVHPNSFMQVNYNQMIKLYNEAINSAAITKDDVVIDAYCGIGTISLAVSKHAKKVYGIEVVKEAVDNAKDNAKLNNQENVEFILGKCEEEIASLVNKTNVDVLIMDPPRKGSDETFLNTIVKSQIKKIVYVSCNPSSLGRDLKYLLQNNYEIKSITPVDLFSHSHHTETVALCIKR